MSWADLLREFEGECGPVLLRRGAIACVRKGHIVHDPAAAPPAPSSAVLCEGLWIWIKEDYETVRDWLLDKREGG